MEYVIDLPDRRQIIKLTWRVEGDEIVSNQPSSHREERTKYSFENGRLILTFGGERTSYHRVGG